MTRVCFFASTCAECGVLFDPPQGSEARWKHLCPTHRAPVMALDLRKDRIVAWAATNWERVETLMLAEEELRQKEMAATLQKYANSHAAALQAQSPYNRGGL